jgi:hypothetical protein
MDLSALIEDYLRDSGTRFFRGRHDAQYFFVVGTPARGRMNVHLDSDGEQVTVSVEPDRYLSAGLRDSLVAITEGWRRRHDGAEAVLLDSSDPALMGLLVRAARRPAGPGELADLVEGALSAAADLFGRLDAGAGGRPRLRDAG